MYFRKLGQGHPRIIRYIIFVGLEYKMHLTKFQGNQSSENIYAFFLSLPEGCTWNLIKIVVSEKKIFDNGRVTFGQIY